MDVSLDQGSGQSAHLKGTNGAAQVHNIHGVSSWSITATADNAAATATRAAEAGKKHYITSISGSFLSAAIKLMTLKDGAGTIGNFHVHNQREVTFAAPIELTANSAAELSLAASGGAGNIGAVTMTGFTI